MKNSQRENNISNTYFFLKIILTLLLFSLIFIAYFHTSNDMALDLGDQLTSGKVILNTHQVPKINLFSYTNTNFPFINTQWLSEVIFYVTFSLFGLNGLIIMTTFVVMLSFSLVYFYAFNKINYNLLAFIAFLYIRVLIERMYVRPEIFSYFFLSLFVLILFKFREKYSKLIYLLIPLELLWVNMHIYFIIGIFIIGCFFLEALHQSYKTKYKKSVITLAIVLLASTIVCLGNPNTVKGALYPFTFNSNYAFNVQENASLFSVIANNPLAISHSVLFFLFISSSLFILLVLTQKQTRIVDWLLSIPLIILGYSSIRNFPLFVFGTIIPYLYSASVILKNLTKDYSPNNSFTKQKVNLFISLFLIALLLWQISIFDQNVTFGLGSTNSNTAVINFLRNTHIKGPIFNNYDVGGTLIYALYPKEKVFVDQKPDAYPAAFFNTIYNPMLENQSIFEAMNSKYKFNLIIFTISDNATTSFLGRILQSNEWKLIYLDQYAIVFVRNTKENSQFTQNAINSSNYKIPDNLSSKDLDNLGYFLSSVGWNGKALEVYEKIYNQDKKNCSDLHNILYLINQNDPSAVLYSDAYAQYCQKNL